MKKQAVSDDDVMFSTPTAASVCATASDGSPDAPEEPQGPLSDL